jgi:hypothetical protein
LGVFYGINRLPASNLQIKTRSMKKSFLPILFVSILILSSFSRSKEIALNYWIIENKKDASLSKKESVIEFSFSTQGEIMKEGDSIRMSYNGTEKTMKFSLTHSCALNLKPGKYKFQFYYDSNFFEIYTDSIQMAASYRVKMGVQFRPANIEVISDKPVIYIYSDSIREVNIQLNLNGQLSFTYPEYKNGWNFTSYPDGKIEMTGKQYDYLFWDGKTNLNANKIDWKSGFIVSRDSLVPFFEKNLYAMGLSAREVEDYITYWCPRMQANEFNYVHFLFNESYAEYASLTINPKPDQLFRVYMIWGKAEENQAVVPQKIESFSRSGFTVVEWGGSEINSIQNYLN